MTIKGGYGVCVHGSAIGGGGVQLSHEHDDAVYEVELVGLALGAELLRRMTKQT